MTVLVFQVLQTFYIIHYLKMDCLAVISLKVENPIENTDFAISTPWINIGKTSVLEHQQLFNGSKILRKN